MEAQLEKEARLLQLQATSRYSQDSAIDSDLQDWDTEILNIDLVCMILNINNNNTLYVYINNESYIYELFTFLGHIGVKWRYRI